MRQGISLRSTSTEQALIRTVLFLRTVGTDPDVRAALAGTGFAQKDADEGWSLLRAACMGVGDAHGTPHDSAREGAQGALDAFAKTMLPRARAALRRLHPPQQAFLFD